MQPEKKLYLKVIIQAIEDLVSDKPVGEKVSESILAKIHAITWFKNNTDDYKDVCDFAEVNSQELRKKVLTLDKAKLQELIDEYSATIR